MRYSISIDTPNLDAGETFHMEVFSLIAVARHWTQAQMDIVVEDIEATLKRQIAAGGVCEQQFGTDGRPWAAFGNGFCIMEARG